MATKQIGIEESVYNRLVEYKNKKALLGKKSSFSFTDAIDNLLQDSETLSHWMGTKTK